MPPLGRALGFAVLTGRHGAWYETLSVLCLCICPVAFYLTVVLVDRRPLLATLIGITLIQLFCVWVPAGFSH